MVYYVLLFVIGTIISWVTLIVVVPFAQKLMQFSFPPWPEALWKLAVVAGAGNALSLALDPVNIFLSWAVGAIVFWVMLYKWFDADFLGVLVIVFVSWAFRTWASMFLLGLLGVLRG